MNQDDPSYCERDQFTKRLSLANAVLSFHGKLEPGRHKHARTHTHTHTHAHTQTVG
jgi:hypothetical protein